MVKVRVLVAVVAILILAAFLRFHFIEAQSFWNDEGNSARLSERSIPAIIEGTASDIHPPLYYLILRGWRELAGDTEFGLRAFSAYAGTLVVATTVALGRIFGRNWPSLVPLVAGLFAAISPVMVYYSQETRMYMLLALIAALSTWVILIWTDRRRGGLSSRRWALTYVTLLAAGLYTHYFFPAVLAAHFLIVPTTSVWPDTLPGCGKNSHHSSRSRTVRHSLIAWGGMAVIAALLYLPWLPIFFRQIGGRPEGAGDLVIFLTDSGRWLWLGSTVRPGEADWAILAGVILAGIGVVAGGRRAVIPLIMILLPLLLMALVGATDPAYFKFLLVIVPFLCLLMGIAWRLTGWPRWLLAGLSLLVLFGSGKSLINMYTDADFARADYREIARRIVTGAHLNHGIILNAPNQWEAFTYYYTDVDRTYPLPRGRPDPAIVEPQLAAIAAKHDRLYVLYWGEGQRDPERIIERWLDANAFKASEEWIGDVRFVVYAVPDETPSEFQTSDARFLTTDGLAIHLKEYAVWPSNLLPGDVVQVRLLWSVEQALTSPYKVFIHLLDADGDLVAQRDSEPGGGSLPTTTWSPDEIVMDNHGLLLPSDLLPGQYTLRLGLYDALDPSDRLLVTGAGLESEDGLTLGTITIP